MAKVGHHLGEGACSLRQNAVVPLLPASGRIINILELRQNIFHFINDDPARKKTLLALALTCESFTGIALDLLWQNLDSFVPLLKCLPASLWKPREFEFQRAMTPDDWSIFRKYNYRVRSLYMGPSNQATLDVIGCPPFSLPLLPSLISLTWHQGTPFSYIRLFATQKLTTLDIQMPYVVTNGPYVQSILSSISSLCHSISRFHFCTSRDSSVDTSAALQCWFQLSYVYTGRLSDAAIIHLANQPSLRLLRLELLPSSISANTQALLQQNQHCVFRALQDLSLISWSLAPLRALFKTVSFSLVALSLTIHVREDFAQLPDVMFHIFNGCLCSTLERLHIRIDQQAGYSSLPISYLVLRPLSSFRSLRKFILHSNRDVQLDDASFLQMVMAWPLLEELTIYCCKTRSSRCITTDTFVALLRLCPHLSSVAIYIDLSAVDRRDVSSKVFCQGFVHENIRRVNFSNSRIRHATGIAAFLSAIAPKLESVSAWTPEYHHHPHRVKYLVKWRDVFPLVKDFSAIRRQERRAIAIAGGADGGDVSAHEEDSEEDMEMESDSTDLDEVSGDELEE